MVLLNLAPVYLCIAYFLNFNHIKITSCSPNTETHSSVACYMLFFLLNIFFS